jgi:signal transduction histidine kinase
LISTFDAFSPTAGSLFSTGFNFYTFGIILYYIISSWKKLKGAQWAIVTGLFFSFFTFVVSLIVLSITRISNPYYSYITLSFYLLSIPLSLLVYVSIRFKEMIREARENAEKVAKLSEEKRVQAENQQKILQEEVNRQTAEIRKTLDNLKATQSQLIQSEKMASLGELTAGIAHEIQNPLNFVNNFSDVNKELLDELKEEAENGNLDEVKTIATDVIKNEEKINHHGKRADAIIKGMLQHSRGSSGKKELTDLNALADEYLRLSYHGLRAKDKSFNADFKLEADKTLPKIEVVPQDIGRVLLNLINNAFYAVSEKAKSGMKDFKPEVVVSTRQLTPPSGGRGVEICVKDNGNGIPESVKEKIFQPFFTTKPTGSGTGLGLSLSYDIVKAHGGELKVESGEGEGTIFTIQLPKTEAL